LGPILELGKLGALEPLPGGVYRLTIGGRDLEVFAALAGGKLLLADGRRALARVRAGERPLAGEERYRRLVERADLPREVVALAYAARRGAAAVLAAVGENGRYDLSGFLAFE